LRAKQEALRARRVASTDIEVGVTGFGCGVGGLLRDGTERNTSARRPGPGVWRGHNEQGRDDDKYRCETRAHHGVYCSKTIHRET